MKAFLLMAGSGPLVILTSYDSIENRDLLRKLEAKGMTKFIAFELPLALVKERYGAHFGIASNDIHESDDLRVLDYNGERALQMFRFDELGPETRHEREAAPPWSEAADTA